MPSPPPLLVCGHRAKRSEPVIVYPGAKKRWWCEECSALKARK